MTKRDLPALSIVELRDFLRRREISPSETLQALEERINAVDPEIGAYLVARFCHGDVGGRKSGREFAAGRGSDRDQGSDQRRGPAMHLCFQDLAWLSCALQRNRDSRNCARTAQFRLAG